VGGAHHRGVGAVISMPSGIPKPKPQVIVRRDRRAALIATSRTVRTAVWRRDGGQCRACQGRQRLQVHHLRWRSQGGKWTTTNCVLLCRNCHQEAHARVLLITGVNADVPDGLQFERRCWW
jgi:5-methylcytosine-specific restriction endonuclease McrA